MSAVDGGPATMAASAAAAAGRLIGAPMAARNGAYDRRSLYVALFARDDGVVP